MLNILKDYEKNDPKSTLLTDLLMKSVSISRCILTLIIEGYETEAFSSWRTLHECECTLLLLDKYGAKINPSMELASYALVVEFSKIGFGIGYVTKDYIKTELKNKELFELKIKEKIPSRYVGMAISKNHLPNFCTKKLIEIINETK